MLIASVLFPNQRRVCDLRIAMCERCRIVATDRRPRDWILVKKAEPIDGVLYDK